MRSRSRNPTARPVLPALKRLQQSLTSLLVLLSLAAQGDPMLSYQIVGIEDELLANVRTYLGPPPETAYERDTVLYSAQRDVESAIRAVEYPMSL